ncbi:MAG: GTPase, partial [Microcystaceae cyanobacterium]
MSENPMEEVPEFFQNFEAIQEDLNYYQAQQTLQNLVKNLDLRAREKAELTSEINHLCELLEKLDQARIQIAVFGLVGRGKSSILNALLGQTIFATGPLHGVTQDIHATAWQLPASDELPDLQGYTLQGWGNAQIQLIDTPGIDEVDGHHRELLAKAVAQKADLILFVIAGDMSKVEYQALSELRQVGKPMILVFNKIDQYPE